MALLNYRTGIKVKYNGDPAIIIKIVDVNLVSVQMLNTNVIHTVKTSELLPFNEKTNNSSPINALTDKEWATAKRRYEIIKPLLQKHTTQEVKQIAKSNDVHFSSIYRWIKLYEKNNTLSSLINQRRSGGSNKSRLDPQVDEIIYSAINELYLSPSKKSISKVIRSVVMQCREKDLTPPHSNTIRNRINGLSEEEVLRNRYGKSIARDKFEPIKKSFPGANYPLSVVQIDHTCVDIILVDEHYRKAFRRPYLTLAVDVFSRMVVGFYLSFDPPGAMGAGMCVSNAILSKEVLLEKHNVKGEWPCWGTMATIHLDNAKEFRGEMLKRACFNYGINIEFRPVATPHWGGHVERLLGTFSKEIHNLAGTTFSNIKDRENYDSKAKASLTIKEFEKWLLTYIINVYHNKIHSSIGMTPLQKYRDGIIGNKGTGIPPKLLNHRKVRLDFMPFVERTVQEYGVLIDHICYYDEVLRKYIHARENSTKTSKKRKFIFKRDPRDISIIYFLDPELNEYFDIPYRDTSKPPISLWEYNEVLRQLQKNSSQINEDLIFETYRSLEEIELKAIRQTKKLKKYSRYSDKRNSNVHKALKKKNTEKAVPEEPLPQILPFDEIDDEAFTP